MIAAVSTSKSPLVSLSSAFPVSIKVAAAWSAAAAASNARGGGCGVGANANVTQLYQRLKMFTEQRLNKSCLIETQTKKKVKNCNVKVLRVLQGSLDTRLQMGL